MSRKRMSREYPAWTPYGKSDFRKNLSDSITFFSSNGRGVFRIGREAYEDACKEQGLLPKEKGAYDDAVFLWFDQSRQWAFVALAFPDILRTFSGYFWKADLEMAEQNILDHFPGYWEFWKGEKIVRGMSKARDYEIFLSEHKNELMSFKFEELHPFLKFTILLTASIGANRNAKNKRLFVVPAEKYKKRTESDYRCRIPYIIDDDREISFEELRELREEGNLDKGSKDLFFPLAFRMDGENVRLECSIPESGEEMEAVVSAGDWEERDLLLPFCFEKVGDQLRRVI